MLAEAGRTVIEQNCRVAAVFDKLGPTLCAYQPLPPAPPLCFLHIPKTGGASAIMWLESMFRADEHAPCRNAGDWEILRGKEHHYRLYAGHLNGCQADLIPADAQWMTILRDPVETAVSAYHHRRMESKENWEEKRVRFAHGDDARDAEEKTLAQNMTELFQKVDLLTALRQSDENMRSFFRDTLTRRLGALDEEHPISYSYNDHSPKLKALREVQWKRAVALLDRIDLIGDHSAMEQFLLLVAATRGWPAPPPIPRLHDFGAPTREDAASPELRAQFKEYSPVDVRIYERSRESSDRVAARLKELCGDVTARAVDDHHRRRFFDEAQQVVAFDVTADEAWNGCGWGLRERDGLGNAYRHISNERQATTLVRLDPAVGEYRLFVHVWHASTQAVLDGFSAQVGGKPLPRIGFAWRNGALIVEWRVPAEVLAATHGNIEVGFEKAEATARDLLWIARIGCVPALSSA